MSTQTLPPPGTAPVANITECTVAINLTIGRIGNHKKVPKSKVMEKKENATYAQDCAVEVDADKNLVGVSKKLLMSKELQAIVKHDSETAEWVKDRSVPSLFKRGVYLVKTEAAEMIDQHLEEAKAVRANLIQAFLDVYDQQKEDAEKHLRGVYDASDYPVRGVVAASFVFEWEFMGFATPEKLKSISAGFFKKEQEKAAHKWAQATEEAKLLLRAQMKDLVDHLVERMTPGDDGKRKTFQKTTISKVSEFLETFKIRDVTDDAELGFLVDQAKGLLNGVDPEGIRKSEVAADCLRMGFETVKGFLDTMVQEAGSRKMVLEDVEEIEDVFS